MRGGSAGAGHTIRRSLSVAGLLSLGTVILTYPQSVNIGSAVGDHYDALFSIWRLSWIARALGHRLALFDANIFFPERLTLAYSDAILLPGVIGAPLIWAGVTPAVVHNLLVLATFPAAGLAMYLLVEDLTGSSRAGVLSAFVFAFSPYRVAHLPQLELLWMWPIPLAFKALQRLIHKPTLKGSALLAGCVVAQVLGCLYYAVFLCVGLAIVGATHLVGRPRRSLLELVGALGAAAALSGLLLWRYVGTYRAAAALHAPRTILDVAPWSARWTAYFSVSDASLLYRHVGHPGSLEMTLFPGIIAIILAVYALRPVSRLTLGYAVLALLSVDLSLGVNGSGLFVLLFGSFGALRVPARAYVLVSTSVAVLAGVGLSKAGDRLRRRHAESSVQWAAALTILAVTIELSSVPLYLMKLDPNPPAVYRWLAVQPTAVVLEWPVPSASSLGVTREPFYMYYSTMHWKPLVNGYSGHYPESYIGLLEAMVDFPSEASIAALHERGVTHIILHRQYDPERFMKTVDAMTRRRELEPVSYERRLDGDVAVFRMQP